MIDRETSLPFSALPRYVLLVYGRWARRMKLSQYGPKMWPIVREAFQQGYAAGRAYQAAIADAPEQSSLR